MTLAAECRYCWILLVCWLSFCWAPLCRLSPMTPLTTVNFAKYNPGNSYWRGRLNTVYLLIKIGCFEKMEKYSFSMKSSWSKLGQGGQLYWSFPSVRLPWISLTSMFNSCRVETGLNRFKPVWVVMVWFGKLSRDCDKNLGRLILNNHEGKNREPILKGKAQYNWPPN